LPLPLFTELPRRSVFSETQVVAKARRVVGRTTSRMIRAKPMTCTAITAYSPADGIMTNPGAPKRMLSTQTTMVSHKLHVFSIHNPTATPMPTTTSAIPQQTTTAGTHSDPGYNGPGRLNKLNSASRMAQRLQAAVGSACALILLAGYRAG
jgi:hypothetical protein